MAKRGKWLQRMRDWMTEYAFVVTLGCAAAVVVSSALYTRSLRTADAGVQAAAQAPEIHQTAMPQVTPLPTIAPLVVRTGVMERETVWPLEGDVLRGHDLLTPVYWEMLETWQAHAGLDIAGAPDAAVYCAGAGVVSWTIRDALWGWTVEIAQEDGRLARYRGLAVCQAEKGARVREGDVLGTLLASVPCEKEMGAHLHLEVERDGRPQDPMAMLPER